MTIDKDRVAIPLSFDRVTKMLRVSRDAEPAAGLHNTMGQPEPGMKRDGEKNWPPRQTQMTQSPRSMLLIELWGTTAQETTRSRRSDRTDKVQTNKHMKPPRNCLLVLSSAVESPDGDT